MNDSLLPFQRLDVYIAAKELARLIHAAKIGDKELREQATLAATIGVMRATDAAAAQELGVRLERMLRGLMHSR